MKSMQTPCGFSRRRVNALLFTSIFFHVGCAHMEESETKPKSELEIAAEVSLKNLAENHFKSVKCIDLQCSFEYSTLPAAEAEKIADKAESDLAKKGFSELKIKASESLSSSLLSSVFFGLGMGLAAALFAVL